MHQPPNPKGSIFNELAVTVDNMQIAFKFQNATKCLIMPGISVDNGRSQVGLCSEGFSAQEDAQWTPLLFLSTPALLAAWV